MAKQLQKVLLTSSANKTQLKKVEADLDNFKNEKFMVGFALIEK